MIEDQFCSVEVNFLGRLLIANPPVFCDHVNANAPPKVTSQLIAVAKSVPHNLYGGPTLSKTEYEEAYFESAKSAFSWQEYTDDATLLEVFRELREYVKIVGCLLYADD